MNENEIDYEQQQADVKRRENEEAPRSGILQKLADADIYNFNSGLNVASIMFLVVTMSTAMYVGYKWGEDSQLWAQMVLMAMMFGIGFFESYTLFYSMSALYYKRYSIFVVVFCCYMILAAIGFFTTAFTLDNVINDGFKKTQIATEQIANLDTKIAEIQRKRLLVEKNRNESIETYYTTINARLVKEQLKMKSSETGKSFIMGESNGKSSPIWMRFCLPNMRNQFNSDLNCSSLQLELTTKINDINNHFNASELAYDKQLTALKDRKMILGERRGLTFDNSATDRLKSITTFEEDSSSDMLVMLLALGVIAVMIVITSLKVFRDGKAYKFYREGSTNNVLDMFIDVIVNRWRHYSEDSSQKLLHKQHKTAVMKHELAMVEANLRSVTSSTSDILNENVINTEDPIYSVKNEDKLLDNILSNSQSVKPHKKSMNVDVDVASDENESRLFEILKKKQ